MGICGYLRLARFDCDNPLRIENWCFPLAWTMDSAARVPRLQRQERPENRDDQTSSIILLGKDIELWGLKVGGGGEARTDEARGPRCMLLEFYSAACSGAFLEVPYGGSISLAVTLSLAPDLSGALALSPALS